MKVVNDEIVNVKEIPFNVKTGSPSRVVITVVQHTINDDGSRSDVTERYMMFGRKLAEEETGLEFSKIV